MSRTGISWQVDTHVIDSAAAHLLRQLRDTQWIDLSISSTTVVEVDSRSDDEHRRKLLDDALSLPVTRGAFVLDHSHQDFDFVSTDSDNERLRRIFHILWPQRDFDADARGDSRKGLTCFRDAKQISEAIRYAFDVFVTCDHKLLAANERLTAAGQRLESICIRTATERSLGAVVRVWRLKEEGSIYASQFHESLWPSADECEGLLREGLASCKSDGCFCPHP